MLITSCSRECHVPSFIQNGRKPWEKRKRNERLICVHLLSQPLVAGLDSLPKSSKTPDERAPLHIRNPLASMRCPPRPTTCAFRFRNPEAKNAIIILIIIIMIITIIKAIIIIQEFQAFVPGAALAGRRFWTPRCSPECSNYL